MQERVAELLAHRDGHFVYESGHHGRLWLDLELLCLHPDRVQPLAEKLSDRLKRFRPEVICGPLIEGAFIGLLTALHLRLPFSYTQPTPSEDTRALFPISYPVPESLVEHLRGRRVVIVNDVINAGSAIRGTFESLRACGANPVGIGALAVYGEAAAEFAALNGMVIESLTRFPIDIWEPGSCPLCANGVPLTQHPKSGAHQTS